MKVNTSLKENKRVYKFSIPKADYAYLLDQLKGVELPIYVFDMDQYYAVKDWGDQDTIGQPQEQRQRL